jgi:hypothetical protein
MSNLWLNLRIWYWHIQVGPDRPYLAVRFNSFRWEIGQRYPWIELN